MSNIEVGKSDGLKFVGSRPIRHDGLEKVTGQARYGADINLPQMLYGKILRSPYAHARIKSIDFSRALALEGVQAVVTSADLPRPWLTGEMEIDPKLVNTKFASNNVLAGEKVLYQGHAVAAVAASNVYIAEKALDLIDVSYEILPTILDVMQSIEIDAEVIHDGMFPYPKSDLIASKFNSSLINNFRSGMSNNREGDDSKWSNIAGYYIQEIGDLDRGFAEADVVVEREYNTGSVHQGYIEPHSATAIWNRDGKVTIWCSSQGHFGMRDQTAQVVGIPSSDIKVIPMEIGGGFGGKTTVYLEPVVAMLSKKTGRPVKITMTRQEVFEGTGPTLGSYMKVKIGATNDGMITAAQALLAYEAGAFPGSPVNMGAQCIFAPYDIPNGKVEGFDILVNKPKVAAYRAPGAPAAAFAGETVIDELSSKLNIDPLLFRLKNSAKEGTRRISGPVFPRIGFLETVEASRSHPHYLSDFGGPNRGRGVAAGFWFNGSGPSSVIVNANADGTVSLIEGSPDIGGTRVAVAMHVAEVLGIPIADVHPSIGDTDSIGFTSMTGGSSVAFKTGWAAYQAAQDLKKQMIERASDIWDVEAAEVSLKDGKFRHSINQDLQMDFKELASILNTTGGPIVGSAAVNPGGAGAAISVHIVDVEVDPETGKLTILRYTVVQDVGKAIHPDYVEGQMQGGAVQGIGWALNEEYIFDKEGVLKNPTFLDYRMPTSLDLPMIDTHIVEIENPGHPYGVRGVGEVPIVPPMAAIANAINSAVGIRMNSLPMSPPVLLEALWANNGVDNVSGD